MFLTQGLHRAIQQRPEAVATVCGDRRQTFSTLHGRVARLAGALQAIGIRPGNPVAMLSLNSDRYLEYYLAVPWAGALVAPINSRWSVPEIIFALQDSESVALFIDENFAGHVDAFLDACPYLRYVIFCGNGAGPEGSHHLDELILRHAAIPDAALSDRSDGSETLGIFYTGGTTGSPKGVLLSHRSVCTSAMALMAEGLFREGAIGLHSAPMFHLADLMMTVGLLLRGGTHVMLPAFRPEVAAKVIQDEGITDVLMVPSMMQALVDFPGNEQFNLGGLRNFLYGASPASEALLERAMKRLPDAGFFQGYGMTEVAALACVLPPQQHGPEGRKHGRLRAAGRAASHVQLCIADGNDRPLPTGQIGEILVRGPNVMQGYWKKPEVTAEALRSGWMHTGDLGYLDKDGFVFIVDRMKDMIISGGENVYSVEVENAIARHPAVAACAVIGVPCATLGERVHAVVVVRENHELSYDDLYSHTKRLIAGYKCPRGMEIRGELPITAAGKVLKTELRRPHWEKHGRTVA